MKEDVLLKFERKIRRVKGSNTIALPNEIIQALKITNDEKVNINILKNGKIQLEKSEGENV